MAIKISPDPTARRVLVLQRRAKEKCAGCRKSWRLLAGNFRHSDPAMECKASAERQELIEISVAAEMRV